MKEEKLRKLGYIVLSTVIIYGLWSVVPTCAGQSQAVVMPYVETSEVVVDGTVINGEYAGYYLESSTDIAIYWEHDGTYMYVALVSPGTGWVGVGFGPRLVGMDGANIIMGYVDGDGILTLVDRIGVGWQHFDDVDRDGTDDIIEKAGSESGGKTILEFVFPLDSGDPNDHSFAEGNTYGFYVSYHASADDLASYHTAYSVTLDLYIEPSEAPPPLENKPPNANFTYTIRGLTVEFTDQSRDPDGTIVSWHWDFGDGSTSTEQNPTHTFPQIGKYTVTLTATDDQEDSNIQSQTFTVPSKAERSLLWTSQVFIGSLMIVFTSLFAIGIATSRKRKEVGGNKNG